jgi:hypothetical protein
MSTAQWRLTRRLMWRLSEAVAVDARMFPTMQQAHLVSASQHRWRSVTDGRLQPVCHKETRKEGETAHPAFSTHLHGARGKKGPVGAGTEF